MERKYLGEAPSEALHLTSLCDATLNTYSIVNFHISKDDLLGYLLADSITERPVRKGECLEAVEKYSLQGPSLVQPTRNHCNDVKVKTGKKRMNLFRKFPQDEPAVEEQVQGSKVSESDGENSLKRNDSDNKAKDAWGCLRLSTCTTGTSISSQKNWADSMYYGPPAYFSKEAKPPDPFLLRRLGPRGSVLHTRKNRRRKKQK